MQCLIHIVVASFVAHNVCCGMREPTGVFGSVYCFDGAETNSVSVVPLGMRMAVLVSEWAQEPQFARYCIFSGHTVEINAGVRERG